MPATEADIPLYANIAEKEAVRVRKELIKICKSVIGILYDSKEWRDKQ